MSENRMGIGQHRTGSVGAGNTGQREVRGTAGDVGMESGGERQNGPVPGSQPINSGVPIHGAEESDFYARNVHRK
jgi:hypothetical protein